MSAFVVQKSTIDAIVTYCFEPRYPAHGLFYAETKEELGQKIWDLNHRAVNQRYRESGDVPKYEHASKHLGLVALYKAVSCLIYQCSEGDCPESQTYQALGYLKSVIADRIISSSKEYEQAAWG